MDLSSRNDAWWAEWLGKWDVMQDAYVPGRRVAFRLMAEILADRFPKRCRVADIGAGTGTLAEEILNRVPGSTVLCLDVEPFVLAGARKRLEPFGERARVVRCDFRKEDFTTEITEGTERKTDESFEAVVSSTTLHWFGEQILQRIYAWASGTLVERGMFLNADHIQVDNPELAQLALDLNETERACLFQHSRHQTGGATGTLTWDEFWDGLGRELGIPAYYDTVARPAWGEQDGPEPGYPFAVHKRLLQAAGFGHVGVLWRHLSDAVLIAKAKE
jgi:SAM-dependent methyltransferase